MRLTLSYTAPPPRSQTFLKLATTRLLRVTVPMCSPRPRLPHHAVSGSSRRVSATGCEARVSVKKANFLQRVHKWVHKIFGSLDFCFYLCYEHYSNSAMQIVSTREFRANQKKYFKLAEHEPVFVSRKNARPIVISVADDDDFLSKEELLSIQKGLEDIKNGRTYRMQEGESLTDFLKRTEECIK